MNKPEWMPVNPYIKITTNFLSQPLSVKDVHCNLLSKGFDEGSIATAKKLLEYLRDHEWYTAIIPQGKGQRIISKKVGISQEFVASLLKQLEINNGN